MKTIQERLRYGADICHARNIQLDYARVATEAADRIDTLEELNSQLREQNAVVDAACAYLERQIDALEAEVASLQLRNQELSSFPFAKWSKEPELLESWKNQLSVATKESK